MSIDPRIFLRAAALAMALWHLRTGLGHGCGFGDRHAPRGTARIGKTGHPSGIYNTCRIRVGRSIPVTGQLAGVKATPDFWWIRRGTENLPLELGGARSARSNSASPAGVAAQTAGEATANL